MSKRKVITFQQYMNIQAKYLQHLHYKTKIPVIQLAHHFAVSLHDRLHSKYIIQNN